MKSTIPAFLLVLLCASLTFFGCSPADDFSADPMGKLRFSADTLSFDTVFSRLGTPTAWMKIYNTGNQKIRISNISLKSGSKGFHLNLDGVSASSFSNVDIPAKDSLFLFVELTPEEQNSGKPLFVNDAIVFQSEGKQKQIVLEAYSQDVVIWRGKTITSDTVLTSDRPFLIFDSLVVAKNVTLRIEPGTTLYFHDLAEMLVRGTLKATGNALAPVTFRGDRLDYILPDLPYDFYPGQWGAVRFTASSFDNILDFVHLRGGNYGLIADSSATDRVKLKMTNSIVHNVTKNCLLSCNSKITIANSQLTNSGSNTLSLKGGVYGFNHCTIANFQRLITREGTALLLRNYSNGVGNGRVLYPLKTDFFNCIVFGSQTSEIDTMKSDQATWELQFRNCMLRSWKMPENMAVNCIYPTEAKFLKLGTEAEKYVYDFRLDSLSEARNQADPIYSNLYPYDMNGISRLADGKPDIGAFEWIPGKK